MEPLSARSFHCEEHDLVEYPKTNVFYASTPYVGTSFLSVKGGGLHRPEASVTFRFSILVFYISFGTIENSWIGYIFSFIKNQNIFRQLFKKNKKNTTRHNLNDTHERCLEQKDFCHFLIEKFLLFLNFSDFKIWEYSHL